MIVTRTVEVPADHRLTIDVPREVPAGPVVITFTPASVAVKSSEFSEAELREMEFINRNAERLNREAMDVLSYQWPGFSEEKLREMEFINRQAAGLEQLSQFNKELNA
jgi:hypothetical protein